MKKMIQIVMVFAIACLGCQFVAAQSVNWSGSYMGLSAGYTHDQQKLNLVGSMGVITSGSNSIDKKNLLIGGIQGGHNWQYDNVVYGLEADFNVPAVKQTETTYKDWGYANDTITTISKVEWFSTLRGRAGFLPQNDLLMYVTGGLAMGRVKTQSQFSVIYPNFPTGNGVVSGSSSSTKYGWTLGVGAESNLTKELSLKLEYLYTDLGQGHQCQCVTGNYWNGDPISYGVKNDTKFSSVKFGLNYKF